MVQLRCVSNIAIIQRSITTKPALLQFPADADFPFFDRDDLSNASESLLPGEEEDHGLTVDNLRLPVASPRRSGRPRKTA